MPALDLEIQAIILLYMRCDQRRCLPIAGGVFDQPERIMRWFDAIDEVKARLKQENSQKQESDLIHQKQSMEMKRGRH